MMKKGVGSVILGCTELPEVAQYDAYKSILIDTTAALIRGTVNEISLLKSVSEKLDEGNYSSMWSKHDTKKTTPSITEKGVTIAPAYKIKSKL